MLDEGEHVGQSNGRKRRLKSDLEEVFVFPSLAECRKAWPPWCCHLALVLLRRKLWVEQSHYDMDDMIARACVAWPLSVNPVIAQRIWFLTQTLIHCMGCVNSMDSSEV